MEELGAAEAHQKDTPRGIVCPNVRVCVRLRPCPSDEKCVILDKDTGVQPTVQVMKEGKSDNYLKSQQTQRLTFSYDAVFGDTSQQGAVYEQTAKPMIEHVLSGRNATVFAYGATGAGKTHTVIGSPEDPGILAHAVHDVFEAVAADPRALTVHVSFMELYNEELRDLLHPESAARAVGEDSKKRQVVVTGLIEREVKSEPEALQALHLGLRRRQVDCTKANAVSSRSHCLCWLQLGETGKRWRSRLALVDLAGSERAQKTQNEGKTAREGANINKSLLALANCINALAAISTRVKAPKKEETINFRDSKLTLILKYSLLGDGLVTMIAAVHPGDQHVDESLNTLEYAARARNIKMRAIKDCDQDEEMTVPLTARALKRTADEREVPMTAVERRLAQKRASMCGDGAVEPASKLRRRTLVGAETPSGRNLAQPESSRLGRSVSRPAVRPTGSRPESPDVSPKRRGRSVPASPRSSSRLRGKSPEFVGIGDRARGRDVLNASTRSLPTLGTLGEVSPRSEDLVESPRTLHPVESMNDTLPPRADDLRDAKNAAERKRLVDLNLALMKEKQELMKRLMTMSSAHDSMEREACELRANLLEAEQALMAKDATIEALLAGS